MSEQQNQNKLKSLKLRVEANVLDAHSNFLANPTIETLNTLAEAQLSSELFNKLVTPQETPTPTTNETTNDNSNG